LRAAFHPIDAESDIEQRSQKRGEPRHADPPDRRRHVALPHQGVRGDRRRDHDMKAAEKKSSRLGEGRRLD
jgi:hypothetical protein